MIKKIIDVHGVVGIHARPSRMIVLTTTEYENCEVTFQRVDRDLVANGKSIIGLLSLEMIEGISILIICDGEKEQELLDKIILLFKNGFKNNEDKKTSTE